MSRECQSSQVLGYDTGTSEVCRLHRVRSSLLRVALIVMQMAALNSCSDKTKFDTDIVLLSSPGAEMVRWDKPIAQEIVSKVCLPSLDVCQRRHVLPPSCFKSDLEELGGL